MNAILKSIIKVKITLRNLNKYQENKSSIIQGKILNKI